jgi:hypothetical protein
VPYLELSRLFQKIEADSSRLVIISLLADYFRSVIALSPDTLIPSVYLCCNEVCVAPQRAGARGGHRVEREGAPVPGRHVRVHARHTRPAADGTGPHCLVARRAEHLRQVAPAYEGKELGVGDAVLQKALCDATGATLAKARLGSACQL